MAKRYIYILNNPAFPYLKIGRTAGSPAERARDLHSTGSPYPFAVIHSELVGDERAAEGEVHGRLARYRVNGEREFFNIDVATAIQVVREVAQTFPVEAPWFSFSARRFVVEEKVGPNGAASYALFCDLRYGYCENSPNLLILKWEGFELVAAHETAVHIAREARKDLDPLTLNLKQRDGRVVIGPDGLPELEDRNRRRVVDEDTCWYVDDVELKGSVHRTLAEVEQAKDRIRNTKAHGEESAKEAPPPAVHKYFELYVFDHARRMRADGVDYYLQGYCRIWGYGYVTQRTLQTRWPDCRLACLARFNKKSADTSLRRLQADPRQLMFRVDEDGNYELGENGKAIPVDYTARLTIEPDLWFVVETSNKHRTAPTIMDIPTLRDEIVGAPVILD